MRIIALFAVLIALAGCGGSNGSGRPGSGSSSGGGSGVLFPPLQVAYADQVLTLTVSGSGTVSVNGATYTPGTWHITCVGGDHHQPRADIQANGADPIFAGATATGGHALVMMTGPTSVSVTFSPAAPG